MKTILFAAAATLCLGIGAAHADGDGAGGEDSGAWEPNSFFTELPGQAATAPGARPNNAAANQWQLVGQQPIVTTQATLRHSSP
jgi:hypothetical protein